jgi:thiol:disulfide interchange protein DsbC
MQPIRSSLAAVLFVLSGATLADEAAIRKSFAERVPNFPKIDEVTKTPVPGLWEVRVGTEVLYTDDTGNFLIDGSIVDLRSKANLTEERVAKLTAIDFAKLPLADAMVWKQGTGARKLVVFADPNCGYCKRFERDLNAVKDVTVYTFLLPILGPDSSEKSKQIWCSKEPTKTWRAWMIDGVAIPKAAACDTAALERNVALGRKHKVNGTPALVFESGRRVPGALPAAEVEKLLAAKADAR